MLAVIIRNVAGEDARSNKKFAGPKTRLYFLSTDAHVARSFKNGGIAKW